MSPMAGRSSEVIQAVLERNHLFHTAIVSLSRPQRHKLVDEVMDALKKKAQDISGFVDLGGWPQVETWCAGDHLCVILAETAVLPRSSGGGVESLFRSRLAAGGTWQQMAFSLSSAGEPAAKRYLAQHIKTASGRDRFLDHTGSPVRDELYRGEHTVLLALSRRPI